MRIAFVSEVFLPAVDGVVTRLRRTLEQLDLLGDEVLVVAPAGGPASYAGARIVGVHALRMPLYPDGVGYPEKRVALGGPMLGRALRLFRPDVIHAVNPVLLAAGGVYYARRLGVPLVASYHANLPAYARFYGIGVLERPGWRYVRVLHDHADLNLCTSNATREMLQGRGVRRLGLWPYGVELDRFAPSAASPTWRARLSDGRPDRTILLYVGRLAKEKSVEQLLPAVREPENVALAIVGDGPLRGQLQQAFAGTATTFLGMLTGAELASAYASADVFVFPSRTETLGMVMLEAHAAGLPVIAADSAAARELIRHAVDGLCYDPTDSRSLVGAVRRLSEERALRAAMAVAARDAVAGATWARATYRLREHYHGLVDAGHRHGQSLGDASRISLNGTRRTGEIAPEAMIAADVAREAAT